MGCMKMNDKVWVPCELHTHTVHSDARHTLRELSESALRAGFRAIALTDHNTMSGHVEAPSVMEETGLLILRGMEWTTFYGHMLALGISDYVDWRDIGKNDIHTGIQRVHEIGGIIGLAHPFRVGSPMCTGCHWEFEIQNWHDVNYIEVWSGVWPSLKIDNHHAFQLWTDKLNAGFRITATSGRDWHDSSPVTDPISVTYLGIDGALQEDALIEAVRSGCVSVSVGPRIACTVKTSDSKQMVGIGGTLFLTDHVPITIEVELDTMTRAGLWDAPKQQFTVNIESNSGCIAQLTFAPGVTTQSIMRSPEDIIWMRCELFGVMNGVHTMLGFTNPIYLSINVD